MENIGINDPTEFQRENFQKEYIERRADLAHQAYGLRGAGGFPLVGGGSHSVTSASPTACRTTSMPSSVPITQAMWTLRGVPVFRKAS